ncbi:hypothetical protein GAO09_29030 [Rhizobiales bacterium RZME27]|uniref:Uncharacterized protein n=1 Tax=Endobacterium cereale TaxID=2663029 RepID=A0A6A8AH19_9HYPH|nr:hypothetical protein [Endobacterium cereale]MQY50079.1 hypothetical protein [Endobacterium cereale]
MTTTTIDDIKFEIGQVHVVWSFFEADLRKRLVEAGFHEQIKRGSIINHWRAYVKQHAPEHASHLQRIDTLVVKRNLLAHGIDRLSIETDAVVGCTGPDGETKLFSIAELKELSDEINQLRF